MPTCPHCHRRVEGDYVSAQAAADIIQQRDLLKVQKADLESKVERQAAWITALEKGRTRQRVELRKLRDRLGLDEARSVFDGNKT